ncbi:MAG TPA: hypothetical protein VG013_23975 [Gemmataceae bacterium]|nr:hypothetical protein [Gemmataceae bacterium]
MADVDQKPVAAIAELPFRLKTYGGQGERYLECTHKFPWLPYPQEFHVHETTGFFQPILRFMEMYRSLERETQGLLKEIEEGRGRERGLEGTISRLEKSVAEYERRLKGQLQKKA